MSWISRDSLFLLSARCLRVAALALFVSTSPCSPSLAGTDPRLESTFKALFQGDRFDPTFLQLQGKYSSDLIKMDRRGLKIAIPKGLGKPEPIGVSPTFRVHGDFDISTDFEIIKASKPDEGDGLGVQILVETPAKAAATIAWNYQTGKEGMTYTSSRITGPANRRQYRRQSKPALSRSGTLRLVRRGPTVTASYRDGPGSKEAVFRAIRLGTDDISLVRVSAHTGWSPHPLEVRLLALTITADGLPGYGDEPKAASKGRLLWLLAGGIVLILVGGIGIAAASRSVHRRDPGLVQ